MIFLLHTTVNAFALLNVYTCLVPHIIMRILCSKRIIVTSSYSHRFIRSLWHTDTARIGHRDDANLGTNNKRVLC